ncbi:MAG: metalloregulator ArsR/SmtB family transcription factor [Candidatus Methanogranum gryphiswaldense]|nr:MAG: metalloregulator ArsR/SmtB family transcription factor [Candidatus Methanogranum sp. U3.2.1]
MNDLDLCLKALSDETRRSIVELLLRYSFCAWAIAKRLDISEAAISQHLKVLRDCGLVTGKKCGYFIQYEVNCDKLHEISSYLNNLTEIVRIPCDPTMENCSLKKRCICHSEKRCKGCDCCNDCKRCHKTESTRN